MTLRRRGSPVALRLWPSPAAKVDHTLNSQLSTLNSQLSTLNYQLSTLRLLNHFLQLCAEHVHPSISDELATKQYSHGPVVSGL